MELKAEFHLKVNEKDDILIAKSATENKWKTCLNGPLMKTMKTNKTNKKGMN